MKINIEIEGITPLILNRFTDEDQIAATEGSRGSTASKDRGTPQEIAESKLYRDADGTIGIPQPNLLRCLVDGGLYEKDGRTKITTQKSSLLYACLDIETAFLPLIHKQGWKVDSRPVRIPATGGRILRHRPMFDDWKLKFVADLDADVIGVKLFRKICDHSGKKIGLGDFRPSTKGPFGKFVIVKWQVEEVRPLPRIRKAA